MRPVSDYVAPPVEDHTSLIAVLESDQGRIMLTPNRFGLGYKLGEEAQGLGAADVDNELIPRLGRRGAMLGTQRETEGEIRLPIIINTTTSAEVRRMVDQLATVLKPANGTARLILENPDTGQDRYRDIVYKSGLNTPDWASPYARKYTITVDYLDPWAYSTELGRATIPVAQEAAGGVQIPLRFPVRFARSGGATDRWGVNEGENPAPVTLRIEGPVEDPQVTLQSHWTFQINGSLAWDEYLVVDPSNATAYIYSTTGADRRAAYTMISSSSRFTDLIIPPGQHAFTFRAIDPTYTARMIATWPHTYASMY